MLKLFKFQFLPSCFIVVPDGSYSMAQLMEDTTNQQDEEEVGDLIQR